MAAAEVVNGAPVLDFVLSRRGVYRFIARCAFRHGGAPLCVVSDVGCSCLIARGVAQSTLLCFHSTQFFARLTRTHSLYHGQSQIGPLSSSFETPQDRSAGACPPPLAVERDRCVMRTAENEFCTSLRRSQLPALWIPAFAGLSDIGTAFRESDPADQDSRKLREPIFL